jgi:hypothetical protein
MLVSGIWARCAFVENQDFQDWADYVFNHENQIILIQYVPSVRSAQARGKALAFREAHRSGRAARE